MRIPALFTAIALTLGSPSLALAGNPPESHAHVSSAVGHFAAIGKALSEDSLAGVPKHAAELKATMDSPQAAEHHAGGAHGSDMAAKHEQMKSALDVLARSGLSLDDAREAYKSLSAAFVPMAEGTYERAPADPNWVVMSCPMAKAEWIQADGTVANPYYGTKMSTCGSKSTDLGSAPASAAVPGKAGHDHGGH